MQKFLDRCIVEEGDPEDENYKVKDRFLDNSWLFKSLKALKIVKWLLDQSNFQWRIESNRRLLQFRFQTSFRDCFIKKTRSTLELSTNQKENWN